MAPRWNMAEVRSVDRVPRAPRESVDMRRLALRGDATSRGTDVRVGRVERDPFETHLWRRVQPLAPGLGADQWDDRGVFVTRLSPRLDPTDASGLPRAQQADR